MHTHIYIYIYVYIIIHIHNAFSPCVCRAAPMLNPRLR